MASNGETTTQQILDERRNRLLGLVGLDPKAQQPHLSPEQQDANKRILEQFAQGAKADPVSIWQQYGDGKWLSVGPAAVDQGYLTATEWAAAQKAVIDYKNGKDKSKATTEQPKAKKKRPEDVLYPTAGAGSTGDSGGSSFMGGLLD